MSKNLLYLLLSLTFRGNVFGQQSNHVEVNNGVDTTAPVYKKIYNLWYQYLQLAAINPDTALLNNYWSPSEVKKYRTADLISHEGFFGQPFYTYPTHKLVLSITMQKDSIYIIKTACYYEDEKDHINILAIINVGVEIINDQYKFINYLSIATKNWKSKAIGNIRFLYPEQYSFDSVEALHSAVFLDSVYKVFGLQPRQIIYVVGSSCDAIKQLRGFDYLNGMGGRRKICGVFDSRNFIAYSGGLGEYYPHELAHVINTYFPNSHHVFLGGISALWGGHFGKPITYHVKRVVAYLDKNHIRSIDLLKFLQLDEDTSPDYVTDALICKKILDKGGVPLLEKAMAYGTTDKDFYRAVKDILGVTEKDLPRYMVIELHKWAKQVDKD